MANSTSQYDTLLRQALQLPLAERLALIEELAASSKDEFRHTLANESLSPEEIAELMRIEPLSPAQVVAEGLLGTWDDVGDGAEWVNEQKRRRKERRKWSLF